MAGYREEMSESQAQGSEIVKKINYAETNAQWERARINGPQQLLSAKQTAPMTKC